MPCRPAYTHPSIRAMLGEANLDIIFTNITCNLPLISFLQTWWSRRREGEKRGGEKKNSEIKFYLLKTNMDVCVRARALVFSDSGSIDRLLIEIYKISNSITVLLGRYVLVYLTNSVKRSLFSAGVNIQQEWGILAQALLRLSYLGLYLPLTLLRGSEVTQSGLPAYREGKRKKRWQIWHFSQLFKGTLFCLRGLLTLRAPCGAADLEVPSSTGAGRHTDTHPHTHQPAARGPRTAWDTPLHSTAWLHAPAVLLWNLRPGPSPHRRNLLYIAACKMCLCDAGRRQADNIHTKSNGTRMSSASDSSLLRAQ